MGLELAAFIIMPVGSSRKYFRGAEIDFSKVSYEDIAALFNQGIKNNTKNTDRKA
ncbi:MAG TPA: hypothetical protein V6D28_03325 [Leptolyngbyaceae cyanobacterium]